jgi:uncharacterized membrane protein YgcG
MQCPFCQTLLAITADECPACRLTFPRTSALLGALPRLAPVVADSGRLLSPAQTTKLKTRIGEIQRRFPQLVVQVVLHNFPADHPFSMHVFWLFNAANFAGDDKRGSQNFGLLLAIDPARGEAAIIPGYGLEPSLRREALGHLLELASPSWVAKSWAAGIHEVFTGLEKLLEFTAIADRPVHHPAGEF